MVYRVLRTGWKKKWPSNSLDACQAKKYTRKKSYEIFKFSLPTIALIYSYEAVFFIIVCKIEQQSFALCIKMYRVFVFYISFF